MKTILINSTTKLWLWSGVTRNASQFTPSHINFKYLMEHSGMGTILTPQISRVRETPIFGSGLVVGIIAYIQLCPIPRPPYSDFSKKLIFIK